MLLLALVSCIRQPPPLEDGPPVERPSQLPTVTPPTAVLPDAGPSRTAHDADWLPEALLAIDAASTSVRLSVFVVYPGSAVNRVLDALERAAARGVTVKVMLDEEGSDAPFVRADLEEAGIQAQLDGPSRVLHSKILIADDVVLVGSHNLTESALTRNHEGSIKVRDAEVADWYADWFDAIWTTPGANPQLPPLDRTDLVPVADTDVLPALIRCMDEATTNIALLLYAVAYNPAYPGSEVDRALIAMEAAAARGVAVRVVLDSSGWIVDNAINDLAITRLRAADIPVWRSPSSITTHAKVLRCDDTLVIGDANWSYSGLTLMHGTSLVTTDPVLVADTQSWIDSIREFSTPTP